MSAFDEIEELPPLIIWQGVIGRVVDGERLTLGLIELDPDCTIREHSHENEQVGILLRGSMTFRIGDESRELGPGGAWSIPANTPHEAVTGPEGAIVIEAFAPVRADWAGLERLEPREPLWP
jgi:quercetin dioxygenase-like cupin family protein